jgi:hypothetical protein
MRLIQIPDGTWIDPTVVQAVRVVELEVIILTTHGVLWHLSSASLDKARETRDMIARLINRELSS